MIRDSLSLGNAQNRGWMFKPEDLLLERPHEQQSARARAITGKDGFKCLQVVPTRRVGVRFGLVIGKNSGVFLQGHSRPRAEQSRGGDTLSLPVSNFTRIARSNYIPNLQRTVESFIIIAMYSTIL